MIQVGIVGYGNLGRGAEAAIAQNQDLELVGIFSRRPPETVLPLLAETAVYDLANIAEFQGKIDVLILCGGSKTDLPEQSPALAQLFNVVDSFDTHARVNQHFEALDKAAQAAGTVALLSVGWDPGLFSLQRLMGESILPEGQTYTFWGKGLSQGHSDAIRRIPGVRYAAQYTVPSDAAIEKVRLGEQPVLSTREKHQRICYVVLEPSTAKMTETQQSEQQREQQQREQQQREQQITQQIVTMPNYFAEYDTQVHFIDEATFLAEHQQMPHGGFVIRSGQTGTETKQHQHLEFRLALESNPEFTASVLVAYARAVARLAQQGVQGAKTIFDIPPGLLSSKEPAELRRALL